MLGFAVHRGVGPRALHALQRGVTRATGRVSLGAFRIQLRCVAVGEGSDTIVHDIESNDVFQILGVTRYSTPQEVAANYRKLAMLYHPDRPGGSEEKFTKLKDAKEMVLVRLGEKEETEVDEKVTRHEAEYSYDEESAQWEFKRGKRRVYADYVDTGVERQRLTIWFVQTGIALSVAWVLFENFVEAWMTETVVDSHLTKEGRMFASGKRKEYEREAERRWLSETWRPPDNKTGYIERFTVEDPFAVVEERRVVKTSGWLDRVIQWFENILPAFGTWLRFLLLPDTVSTKLIL
eukprot:Sspe_Gene.100394::Locus_75080_Transcript_2_3_Confidence_0.333_Length_1041::g.100394::m.100394